jgi:hypothetical protein
MPNLFPKWSNRAPKNLTIALSLCAIALVCGITYYCTPKYLRVGYTPIQPVAFDHHLHVTQLGLDCRYCHTFVDRSEHANVPATSTCMNCHQHIQTDSPALAPVRDSMNQNTSIPWVRIHKTPEYVYFNHAVHVNRGISCVHCHGKVNEMHTVGQQEPLHMAFCLDCHRNPEAFIRPLEHVYDLNWQAESPQAQQAMGERLVHDWKIMPPQSCSGCHR